MLFNNNIAFVPTNLVFAPGEMRLFTIKATLGSSSYIYNGKQISLDVSAIEVSSNVSVPYSIKGTTWVINNLI
jgi:hypothetical protein